MKKVNLYKLIALGAVLALGIPGCSGKKPVKLTKIPGGKVDVAGGGPTSPTGPGTGPGTLPPTPPVTPGTGIGTTIPITPTPITPGTGGPGSFPAGPVKENGAAFAAQIVHFDYDSAVVMPVDVKKIETVAQHMKQNEDHLLVIEGHCDERGTEEYNRALGERRALSVREKLMSLGVEGDRMRTVSYGEDVPMLEGATKEAWQENRRGEFVLLEPAP